MHWCLQHRMVILSIKAGVALGGSFIFPALWLIGVVGVALLLGVVHYAPTWQRAAVGVLVAWTTKALFGIWWFWSTYPVEFFSSSVGLSQLVLIGFYWLTTGLALGSAGFFLGLSLWLLRKRLTLPWYLLAIVPLWLGTEVASSLAFSVFTFGPGSSVNAFFSVGYIGYILANHPVLIFGARLAGVYSLTALAVFLGSMLYVLLLRRSGISRHQRIALCLGLLLLYGTSFLSLPVPSTTTQGITVAIVDTDFGGAAYRANSEAPTFRLRALDEALRAALALQVPYILMPEEARFYSDSLDAQSAYDRLRFLYQDPTAVIIEAGRYEGPSGVLNLRATVHDGQAKKVYAFDKEYLVPQGEYMPYFYSFALHALGYGELANTVAAQVSYLPGKHQSQSLLPAYAPAILFCFSQVNPLAVHQLLKEHQPPFIAHPISHSWFTAPHSMWHQYDAMLKVQALWNQVPIVSAGNMARGYLYTSVGTQVTPEIVASGEGWRVSVVSW